MTRTTTTEWLEIFAELVLEDKELHDATVKLILSSAENVLSQAEMRRARTAKQARN